MLGLRDLMGRLWPKLSEAKTFLILFLVCKKDVKNKSKSIDGEKNNVERKKEKEKKEVSKRVNKKENKTLNPFHMFCNINIKANQQMMGKITGIFFRSHKRL